MHVARRLTIINVPVVYMARDVMILMRATSFRGTLEGMGPKNRAKRDEVNLLCPAPPSSSPIYSTLYRTI
jgi:hypothetical protein